MRKLSQLTVTLSCIIVFSTIVSCPCSSFAKKLVPLKENTILRVGQTAVHVQYASTGTSHLGLTCEKGDKRALRLTMKVEPNGPLSRTSKISHLCTALKPTPFVGLKASYENQTQRFKVKIVPRDSLLSDQVFKTISIPLKVTKATKNPKKVFLFSKDERQFILAVPSKLHSAVRQMKIGHYYNARVKIMSVMSKTRIRGNLVSISVGKSPRPVQRTINR